MSDWRARAACLGMDTDLFFPETYRPVSLHAQSQLRLAQQTCADCPVRLECLAWATELPERYGIWGGVGEHARKARTRLDRRKATDPALALM